MTTSVLTFDEVSESRKELRTALATHGDHQIQEACSLDEALDILLEKHIDVIILSSQSDGWETLRIIKDSENGWPELKVILYSPQQEPEDALKAWEIGADYFMCKGNNFPHSLVETLDRVID